MPPHDFDRAALVLHFSHDSSSSHSLSNDLAPDGYIVVPKADRPDRVPLAPKSHNVQNPLARTGGSKAGLVTPHFTLPARPCTPETIRNPSLVLSFSRPCTPFQPLPPVLATSPLRIPSFLDLALQSLDNEPLTPSLTSEPPSPPPRFRKLSIEIPSVSHPNSPYVPWASPVRRNILRPMTPSSHVSAFSRYSRPYSRTGAMAPEPQEPVPQSKLLKLSKSFKNLRKTVKQGVKNVKRALKKTTKPFGPLGAATISPPTITFPPPLPSPVASCESSNTTTLAVWLRQCEMNLEHATPHPMTLEEYEERGSWRDESSVRDEHEYLWEGSEIHSAYEEPEQLPSPGPMSPSLNSHSFPHLSMHDIWPIPPRYPTPSRGFSGTRDRELRMLGGWSLGLKDLPA